jgi:hypothetical protein
MQMTSPALSLLTLPPIQRRIVTHLAREGSADPATLAQRLMLDPTDVQRALLALQASGHVRLTLTGTLEANLGRTRRRTLPARLWPALQTASRLYSVQEIMTLRIAVPIVQFARAKLGEFTDHGPGHILRVKVFATQLGYILGLTPSEQHLLRAAALFHDVGNIIDRAQHHIISQETVAKLVANGQLPFSIGEAALIGLLCRWHRKEYDPNRTDLLHGETIRTGLAASILRVADALDSDYRRVDYGPKFKQVVAFFFPHELPFMDDLETILGIRIRCTPALQLQVFVHGQAAAEASYHIGALRKDVAETPLPCTIQVIKCARNGHAQVAKADRGADEQTARTLLKPALLVAPFDPHSLVMAALSYKQLRTAGYSVELLIYPDTHGATAWLWAEGLRDFSPSNFAQLVVIGDRPDAGSSAALFAGVAHWQQRGATVTLLNRHQANWVRLPELLRSGVQITLGGDWTYFWGDSADEADLFWGRIAALCTRDPIQSTVGLSAAEERISQGLLKVLYDVIAGTGQPTPADGEAWVARAMPILERIIADDQAWFAAQAAAFSATYAVIPCPPDRQGKVLRFDLATIAQGHTLFWGLERAIETNGRATERGIAFNMPYAIATWVEPHDDGSGNDVSGDDAPVASGTVDAVQILAINHWREEEATPIRLLYPADLGPVPEGNESTIRVRLPAAQAAQLVQALIAACNEG